MGTTHVIDIEALAVSAFLIEVTPQGNMAAVRLNAVARAHLVLVDSLSSGPSRGGAGCGRSGASLWPVLGSCAARRLARDVTLSSPGAEGPSVWRASIIPLVGHGGRVAALLGICREDRVAGQDHPRAGDHLSLALQTIRGAEWRYDVRTGLYEGSDEIATLIGEAVPRPVTWAEWLERVHPQDLASFLARPEPEGTAEFRFRAAGGETRWGRCSRVALAGEAGTMEAVLGIMVDVTQERVRETAWADLATHDPLTGLLNRRGLRQEIDRLQGEPGSTPCLALFAVDLDRFKETNDTHGHAAGDAVLAEVARRFAATVPGAACARLGGDEFVAVLHVADEAEAEEMRARLQQAFHRPLAFRGRWLPVSASVGVAFGPGSIDAARLMDDADADLYGRKRARSRAETAEA